MVPASASMAPWSSGRVPLAGPGYRVEVGNMPAAPAPVHAFHVSPPTLNHAPGSEVCSNCGILLIADNHFCGKCGAPRHSAGGSLGVFGSRRDERFGELWQGLAPLPLSPAGCGRAGSPGSAQVPQMGQCAFSGHYSPQRRPAE
ncbi:unnamed protein product, partial [Polarella glacialis]